MPEFSAGPTWDLLIGVCLLLVIIYGFIIGQSKTIKTLLLIYPAYFIADLLGAFLPNILPSLFPEWKIALISNESTKVIDLTGTVDMSSMYTVVGIKVFFFLVFWILLITKSPFSIEMYENKRKFGNALLHFFISLIFGILFINTILLLLSGYSVFSHSIPTHLLANFMEQSFLITLFIKFYGSWFAAPAFILFLWAFLHAPIIKNTEEVAEVAEEEVKKEDK